MSCRLGMKHEGFLFVFLYELWVILHSESFCCCLLICFMTAMEDFSLVWAKSMFLTKKSQLISLVSHCTLNTPNKHWNIIPVFKSINLSLMSGCIMFPLPFVTCTNTSCALFYYLLNYVSTFYVWNVKDCRTSSNSVGSHIFQEIVLDMSFGSLQREVQHVESASGLSRWWKGIWPAGQHHKALSSQITVSWCRQRAAIWFLLSCSTFFLHSFTFLHSKKLFAQQKHKKSINIINRI